MSRNSLKNVCRLINSAKAELSVEQEFLADLKRSIELTDSKNTRLPSKTYKPSSLNCIRNMYYQVMGQEPDKNDSSYTLIGICESGTDRHERTQNAISQMKDNNIDCEYVDVGEYVNTHNLPNLQVKCKQGNETKLYDKVLNLSFLCDGIILYKGQYYIIEIKTESISKWADRKDINPKHKMQGIAYSTVLNIDKVIYIYINRDNTSMKTYLFNVTEEMKNNFVSKLNECDNYVNKSQVPPKPENLPKSICEYCNYKKTCRKEL